MERRYAPVLRVISCIRFGALAPRVNFQLLYVGQLTKTQIPELESSFPDTRPQGAAKFWLSGGDFMIVRVFSNDT